MNRVSLVLLTLVALSAVAYAQHEQTFSFSGTNGANPLGGLVADAAGNLYGVTSAGGTGCAGGCGTVFELSPPSQNSQGSYTVLHYFENGVDGSDPIAPLTIDPKGNIYGTTFQGGTQSFGTIFELSPPSKPGAAWSETILYTFLGLSDGGYPGAASIFDSAGNLYGTTTGNYAHQSTIWELSPPAPGGSWTLTTLYTFNSSSGAEVPGPLVFDGAGNLFGTTVSGGTYNQGTVFELSPPPAPGGSWTENTLHSFVCNSGCGPDSGVILSKSGAIAGTAEVGGTNMKGVVFGMLPPPSPGSNWIYAVLYNFGSSQSDGSNPVGNLIQTTAGTLYGTTAAITPSGDGTVFELIPPPSPGGAWTENVLYTFPGGTAGSQPYGGVIINNFALWGTTIAGGSNNFGTIFRLSR